MEETEIELDEIERALNAEEFCFYFQPKISFFSGRIVGGEALLRWIRPDGIVVPPGAFLPQAERSGLITDITAVMLPRLIDSIEAFRAVKPDIQIAFNVSALDLYSPYLVKILRSSIGSRRIDPGNIQIEITETAVVDSTKRIEKTLFELVALGIEIAMDDYGTGYSSLDLLSRMPFSTLKLDQGVVGRMSQDARSTLIVRSSLYLARELSVKTVAEGVEDEKTYLFLMTSGCNEVQGYWIKHPLPEPDFIALCEENPKWPSSSLGQLFGAWSTHNSYRQKVLDITHTLTLVNSPESGDLPKMDLVHSPAHCRFGQLVSTGGNDDGSASLVKALDGPHRLMHTAGENLIKVALSASDPNTSLRP